MAKGRWSSSGGGCFLYEGVEKGLWCIGSSKGVGGGVVERQWQDQGCQQLVLDLSVTVADVLCHFSRSAGIRIGLRAVAVVCNL